MMISTRLFCGSSWLFSWNNGRQLVSATGGGKTLTFTYGVDGIRDSKTVSGTTYQYLNQNSQVVRQTGGGHTIDFVYDNNGRPACMVYDGTTYHLVPCPLLLVEV